MAAAGLSSKRVAGSIRAGGVAGMRGRLVTCSGRVSLIAISVPRVQGTGWVDVRRTGQGGKEGRTMRDHA